MNKRRKFFIALAVIFLLALILFLYRVVIEPRLPTQAAQLIALFASTVVVAGGVWAFIKDTMDLGCCENSSCKKGKDRLRKKDAIANHRKRAISRRTRQTFAQSVSK